MKFIGDVSNKQMTRSEFLKVIGVAVIALFGIGNLVAALSHQNRAPSQNLSGRKAGNGFGSSKFGA